MIPSSITILQDRLNAIDQLCSVYHKTSRKSLQDEIIEQISEISAELIDATTDLQDLIGTASTALSAASVEPAHSCRCKGGCE